MSDAEQAQLLEFFLALEARNPTRAKELFDALPPDLQRTFDQQVAGLVGPSALKPWLRSHPLPPEYADRFNEDTSTNPSNAKAAATYEWWRAEVMKSPSASAYENLGLACEASGRIVEAREAYTKAIELAGAADEHARVLRDAIEERLRALDRR